MNKRLVSIKMLARITFCCTAFSALISIATFNVVRAVGGVRLWQISGRDELLKGDARNISITDAGAIVLAPRFEQVADTQQPFVWSSARGKNGDIFLGTGHDGKVYRIGADGKPTVIFDAPELDVTALAVKDDGTLYAATSPDGKVYRLNGTGGTSSAASSTAATGAAASAAETFFDPPDKYIWSLAVLQDGSLAVGTGDAGKIYRVGAANQPRGSQPEASLLYDADETHIISLATDRQGRLIAGTDPGGLVLQINVGENASGAGGASNPNNTGARAFALFDAPLREIHQLAVAPDNSIYALALSDAAATATNVAANVSTSTQAGVTATVVSTTIVEDASSAAAQTSRNRNDLTNARSAVFRLTPDGGADVVWSSASVTAFALAFDANRQSLLVGTSDKGRIYAITDDGRDTLLAQASEGQISTLVANGAEFFAATSNAGKLFRLRGEQNAEGVYESPVHDAGFAAKWGQINWRASGDAELQTRTGNTASPDETWSVWSAAYRTQTGANIASPTARYIQWRATLRVRGASAGNNNSTASNNNAARVENVTVAYLPRNVAPDIVSVSALPPGVALQSNQQPVDPNIAAANLDPVVFGALTSQQNPPRRVFQRNAVSLVWQAEDRNADELRYAIYYRAAGEAQFRLLKEGLTDNFYTIDGATLAEDEYVFKIVASDEPSNPPNLALTGERLSEPVIIDNTPPTLQVVGTPQTSDAGGNPNVRVRFFAEDKTSRIRRVEWSVNGTSWTELYPDDGVSDGRRESFTLDVPRALFTQAGGSILLRAFDQNGNVGSTRIKG